MALGLFVRNLVSTQHTREHTHTYALTHTLRAVRMHTRAYFYLYQIG